MPAVDIDIWNPPFNKILQRERGKYEWLERAEKPWRISVSIPHLKDAYWLAVNYALVDEAKRLGIALHIYSAGGYDKLDIQRRQIQECMSDHKMDGLIVSAIQQDGMDDIVEDYAAQGIPVLDLINGISSTRIAARVAVSYWDMGFLAGRYLCRLHADSGTPIRVAWFPGPEGAGWVAAGDTGFRIAIADSPIEIVAARHGDTGRATQSKLIEDVLKSDDDLDYIVGTTVTAETAVSILRRHGLSEEIHVVSYYYSPGVHRGIKRGTILAAPTDQQALQARIAINQMVRILEGREYLKHVAPRAMTIDRKSLNTFDESTTLSPMGFRPIFIAND